MKKFDLESYIKGLSPELQEKARACTSVEELLKLADENNIELSADQLEAVTGGSAYTAGTPAWNYHITHPTYCFNCRIEGTPTGEKVKSDGACASDDEYHVRYRCNKCGEEWWATGQVIGGAEGKW